VVHCIVFFGVSFSLLLKASCICVIFSVQPVAKHSRTAVSAVADDPSTKAIWSCRRQLCRVGLRSPSARLRHCLVKSLADGVAVCGLVWNLCHGILAFKVPLGRSASLGALNRRRCNARPPDILYCPSLPWSLPIAVWGNPGPSPWISVLLLRPTATLCTIAYCTYHRQMSTFLCVLLCSRDYPNGEGGYVSRIFACTRVV
jgi:hypothetical protein